MRELSLVRAQNEISRWSEVVQNPLWYMELVPIIKDWFKQFPQLADSEREAVKEVMDGFFEQSLADGNINLGKGDNTGENLDQFRQPITLAVIHHTSKTPVTWQRLSAMALIRQYALNWYEYDDFKGIKTQGKPIWSNHYREGKQVFYDYHWLVRKDGEYERLLLDENVGFHAGTVNPHSVGIAIDGSFWQSCAPVPAIEAIVTILNTHYPFLQPDQIVGHREVAKTNCPGDQFINGWKEEIIGRMK